jgi:hypothetical protein
MVLLVTKSTLSGATAHSEQALTGLSRYACVPAGLWANQIPAFDTEKPLG